MPELIDLTESNLLYCFVAHPPTFRISKNMDFQEMFSNIKYVKFGMTKRNIRRRLNAFRTGSPLTINFLCDIPLMQELSDKHLHSLIKEDNARGEWFNMGYKTRMVLCCMMFQNALTKEPDFDFDSDYDIFKLLWTEMMLAMLHQEFKFIEAAVGTMMDMPDRDSGKLPYTVEETIIVHSRWINEANDNEENS